MHCVELDNVITTSFPSSFFPSTHSFIFFQKKRKIETALHNVATVEVETVKNKVSVCLDGTVYGPFQKLRFDFRLSFTIILHALT